MSNPMTRPASPVFASDPHVSSLGVGTAPWANQAADNLDYLAAKDRWKVTTVDASNAFGSGSSRVVSWELETYDPWALHDNNSLFGRVFITLPGLYQVRLRLGFAANSSGIRQGWISQGPAGTTPSTGALFIVASKVEPAAALGVTTVEINDDIPCSAGDVLWAVGFQNSGSSIGVDTAAYASSFSGHLVSLS